MRHLLQFRLRTMLLAVFALAAVLAFGPKLWNYVRWQHKVNRAFENVLEQGPEFHWDYAPHASQRSEDYALLLSDLDRIMHRLVRTVETERSHDRRIHALETMQSLMARSGSAEIRARYLQKLIAVLATGSTARQVQEQLALLIADWIPSTGVTVDERGALLAMAIANSPEMTPGWAQLLIALGGRDEILLVLEHGGGHDEKLLWAIHNSELIRSRWPGLLPYIKKWLKDPIVAKARVLDSSILALTDDGRRILLDYTTDSSNPPELRKQAIERLKETLAGVELLLAAADAQEPSHALAEVVEGDPVEVFQSAQTKLNQRNADELWTELIDGLDPSYWIPGGSASPEADKELEKARRDCADKSLACLQLLADRFDFESQDQWRDWYLRESPGVVTQERLVRLVCDRHELLWSTAILRRIVPYHIGRIPPECLPVYKEMLHASNPASKYWACHALLLLSDDLEAVPVAIELIDKSTLSAAAFNHSGEIALLKVRFAVNFFWDTAAWRHWWKEYESQAPR